MAPRRAPRILANQEAVMITSEGDDLAVVITDLSAKGFRLKALETLYVGENVFIGDEVIIRPARTSAVRAKILWALGCEAGGIFVEPVGDI